MITAQQAIDLAMGTGASVDSLVECACLTIQLAATNRDRQIALAGPFWSDEGYKRAPRWVEACEKLQALGFKVIYYACDGGNTVIKW
jgi:hypothetical protein